MAEDIDQQVRELKTRADTFARQRSRAEFEKDNAEAAKAKAISRLKAEFGVDTPADAKALLSTLESELEGHIQATKTALDQASA